MIEPNPVTADFLVVGQLGRPHGVRGEIHLRVETDFPERITPGTELLLGEDRHPLRVRSARSHQQHLLVAFEGVMDRTQVLPLVNLLVFVPAQTRPPLPAGEYYHHQLLGMHVTSDDLVDGEPLSGELIEVLRTGANDVYVIHTQQGREILLPALEQTVLSINLETKEMRVHLLDGLLMD